MLGDMPDVIQCPFLILYSYFNGITLVLFLRKIRDKSRNREIVEEAVIVSRRERTMALGVL